MHPFPWHTARLAAAPIQPVPPDPYNPPVELLQLANVPGYPIVAVMALELPTKRLHLYTQSFVAIFLAPFINRLERPVEPFARGLPDHCPSPFPCLSPVVGK